MTETRDRGSAIILSIFFTFVIFTLTTVLFARARQNQLYTKQLASRTERHYLAKAAVNQFMVDLDSDGKLIERGADTPVSVTWDDYEGQVWVEPDPDTVGLFHVVGICYPVSRPELAVTFSRAVSKQDQVEAAVIASIPTLDRDVPDSLMIKKTTEAEWKPIAPPPLSEYDRNGNMNTNEARSAGNFRSLCTSPDGYIYGKYTPIIEDPGLIGILLRKFIKDGQDNPDSRTVGQVRELNKLFDTFGTVAGGKDGAVMRYDGGSESWEALPPIPDRYYDSSGNLVDSGKYGWPGMIGAMAATEDELYASGLRKGNDALMRFDFETNDWETVPSAPNAYYDASGSLITESGVSETPYSVVTNPDGEMFSTWQNDKGATSFKYDKTSKSWTALPPLPNGYYDAQGDYVVGAGAANYGSIVDAGAEGELYAVNFATLGDPKASSDAVYVLEGDTWTVVAPPKKQSISIDGEITGSGGLEQIINMVTSDKGGSLVAHYRHPKDYDRIYQKREDGFEVLPRIPKKRYNNKGDLVQDSGHEGYVEMGIGGAIRNAGGERYVSTASF